MEVAGKDYTVDITALTQSNDDTGDERKIRHVTSAAILPDAGDNAAIVISEPKKARKAPTKSAAAKSAAKGAKSAANGKASAASSNGSASKSAGKSGRRELVNIDENGGKLIFNFLVVMIYQK